jgi:uncharacterized protein
VRLVERIVVPPRTGRAFTVRQGQHLRIVLPDGPQVVDLDAFNLDDLAERFSSSESRRQAGHLSVGHQLLSIPPWQRAMLVIVGDTVPSSPRTRSHDLLYGRCSRRSRIERYSSDTPGCQENLAEAIAAYALTPMDVHDPFNVFMNTGVGPDDQLFFEPPSARAGDYLEMRAELNCLIAVSTCPGASSGPEPHAVHFEIYGP